MARQWSPKPGSVRGKVSSLGAYEHWLRLSWGGERWIPKYGLELCSQPANSLETVDLCNRETSVPTLTPPKQQQYKTKTCEDIYAFKGSDLEVTLRVKAEHEGPGAQLSTVLSPQLTV